MDLKKKCQSHLWLLTGTGEGHVFAQSLSDEGWKITVSVVSERASIPYERISLENVLVGPLNSEDKIRNIILKARKKHNGFYCVVDLTHPFAVNITPKISRVCKELNQPFIRYERSMDDISNAFLIKKFSDLVDFNLKDKSILFAVGSRKLQEAINVTKTTGLKIYARVLANPESLKKTLSSSILMENIAVLNPSMVSKGELEKALIRKWNIDGVVCRQSGGLTEKLWQHVCSSMDLELWMLERPTKINIPEVIDTYEKLSKRLKSINI